MNKRIKKKLAKKQPIIKPFLSTKGPDPLKVVRTKDHFGIIYLGMKEADATSQYKATYVQHLHNGEVTNYGHIFR